MGDLSNLADLIYRVRGRRVMLSSDLAGLYGVPTKVLVQAVKRNRERFPEDFSFQLTQAEFNNLRSQFVTSSWGGHRWLPYAFSEQGVAMLSSVLHSPQAIQASISIMRAFVKARELAAHNREILVKLEALEKRVDRHDADIGALIDAIRESVEAVPEPEEASQKRIGFKND